MRLKILTVLACLAGLLGLPSTASATPVCTDGYMGGPPLAACGGRVFPESEITRGYIQYSPDPAGFIEYQHGMEYLAELYPRWISVFSLRDHFNGNRNAVSAGDDEIRSYEEEDRDVGDGRDIFILKITDHNIPDKKKKPLFFSLSVHGNERGGLEGGMRTAEDLAIAAEQGGTITDGVENYETTTGTRPKFHEYEVKDVLKEEVIYLSSFNPDGWAVGDTNRVPTAPYARGNSLGTDLNRQMPTVGRINEGRNPLQESEMKFSLKLMREIAREAGGLMAYGADVHGELTSNAYVDIMYPAGQFDSLDHRTLMAIAERTKSNIDETLYEGIINQIEEGSGGDSGEGPSGDIPTKPAHWATVWDTLGYTDTGFIGDYLATDLAVTGMDYEIFLNHTVPDKTWNVYLQENHINATRQIIKTAMAYALFQKREFRNFELNTRGRAGYVDTNAWVTDRDANGAGTLPGPNKNGKGQDGKPVRQRHYRVTNLKWFKDTTKLMSKPFVEVQSNDVARGTSAFRSLDTLVLADAAKMPASKGANKRAYFKRLGSWVKKGGNLVLTDRSLHALADMGLVEKAAVTDIQVYQPYSDIQDFEHHMVKGLRPNARQLVETPPLGYCIGNECSPMTVVEETAFTGAEGHVVGTTGDGQVSVGEIPLGSGIIRIVGGALPTPTEKYDHRYGLRNYAMTYTGLYIMENSITYSKSAKSGSRKAFVL